MEKGRVLLLSAGALFALAVVSILSLEAQGVGEAQANAAARADVVKIDAMSVFGKLELPPVTFLHDKHTAALEKAGKDCKSCHPEKDGKVVVKFKREKETTQAEVKVIYHKGCIGCHDDMAKKGQKTGPLDGACRSCHDAKPKIVSAKEAAGLNNALHFRHSESKEIPSALKGEDGATAKDNCDRCHHEYNKDTKKTFYAKGKEGTCRGCHEAKPTKESRSMAQASHDSCVNCHLALAKAGKKDTGPVQCAGCHSKEAQEKIAAKNKEAVAKAPEGTRLIRRQGMPELTLVSIEKPAEGQKPMAMSPVAFNHKLHEKNVDTCRACHHKETAACSKCHTVKGGKEGGFVQLEKAMHLASSQRSCVGCHNTSKADAKCSGCHDLMKSRKNPPKDSCKKCHVTGALKVAAEPGHMPAYWLLKPEEKAAAAAELLKNRADKADVYTTEDIPEKVVIKSMVNEYEESVMPHRKIVMKLVENIKDSKMSGVFHADPGTLCQACHHNSPASKKPPKCVNCHGQGFDSKQPARPGLKAAYHGQCMGCHKSMALKKPLNTDCVGCHKEKKK